MSKSAWRKMYIEPNESFDYTMKIIDDALCWGFEFKVENGSIYFREMENL